MTDKERLDLMEEMMSKGENIHFRSDNCIELFTIVSQHIRGTSVRDLLDTVGEQWERAGRKPDPWGGKSRMIKRKGVELLAKLERDMWKEMV